MAALVEILQVERVVPNLINVCPVKIRGANLELKHKDFAIKKQHRVYSPSKSRNDELEIKPAPTCVRGKRSIQELNLYNPSIPLAGVNREFTRCR